MAPGHAVTYITSGGDRRKQPKPAIVAPDLQLRSRRVAFRNGHEIHRWWCAKIPSKDWPAGSAASTVQDRRQKRWLV